MDAIPIASRAATANGQYSVMIFDRDDVYLLLVTLHHLKRPTLTAERPISNFIDLGARDCFLGRRGRFRPRSQRRQADNAK